MMSGDVAEHVARLRADNHAAAADALERCEEERKRLERERQDLGPFFVRDMARIAGLPDDADMNQIAEALRKGQA